MPDVYDRATRRRTMQRIRKTDTKPEMLVRSVLHRLGLRFRLHQRSLPGVPDIVIPRHKIVVLVHGCFWHQHSCKLGKMPKSNLAYWTPKLERNKQRDSVVEDELRRIGWGVIVVWECEIATRDDAHDVLKQRLPRRLFSKARKPRLPGGRAS